MKKRFSSIAVFALLAACGEAPEPVAVVREPLSSRTFGAYCQEDYQNGWLPTLPSTWTLCGRFVDDFDDTDIKSFYWNLHGAKSHFLEGSDTTANAGLDSVDHLFYVGHASAATAQGSINAGASGISALFSMWDAFRIVGTANMRLGDDSRQLSVFAAYTAEIHAGGSNSVTTPGQIPGFLYIDRWIPAFRGGLRLSTGSVEMAAVGSSFADVGKRYSNNLQAGQTFVTAWSGALNIGSTNDPSLVATGASDADCRSRRDSMTLSNHSAKPRLRDSAIGWVCRLHWENI